MYRRISLSMYSTGCLYQRQCATGFEVMEVGWFVFEHEMETLKLM